MMTPHAAKRAASLALQMTTAATQLAATAAALRELLAREANAPADKEYLSVKELIERIPYREQTIRNLMSAGVFREGVHYYRRRGRVAFLWTAVQAWLREPRSVTRKIEAFIPAHHARTRKVR